MPTGPSLSSAPQVLSPFVAPAPGAPRRPGDRFQGADLGIGRVALPLAWTVLDQVRRAGRFVMVAAGAATEGFAPNFVASEELVAPDLTLRQWHHDSADGIGQVLASYRLIDVRGDAVGGYPALVRLGAYGMDRRPLTVAQWFWLIPGEVPDGQLGVSVTATCHTRDYPALDPVFAGIVHSYSVVR